MLSPAGTLAALLAPGEPLHRARDDDVELFRHLARLDDHLPLIKQRRAGQLAQSPAHGRTELPQDRILVDKDEQQLDLAICPHVALALKREAHIVGGGARPLARRCCACP